MQHLHSYKEFNSINESEGVKVHSTNKTAFMTLDEYKEHVSPVLKAYRKFLKKNKNYFKANGWNGLEQLTYPEYETIEIEKLKRQGFDNIATKEYIKQRWNESGRKSTDKVPKKIYDEYLEYIGILKGFFGEQINKVESDETNKNKRSIRRAIDNDTYIEALIDGIVSPERLEEIVASVGLKLPKRILVMKQKVETEGYTRSMSDQSAEMDVRFAEKIQKILHDEDVVKQLKQRKKDSIMKLVEAFEESETNNIYNFSIKMKKTNPDANSLLNKLFETEKNNYSRNAPVHRVEKFDEIIENISIKYVDDVILRFISRTNQKLAVINKKIGLPDVKMGEFDVRGDIEGTVDLIWDNGFELKLKARIILAGGTYLQRLHERYLLHFSKDGKKIEIEQIDKSF